MDKPVYMAVITDGDRNSFPMVAWSIAGILTQINQQCQFAFAPNVTRLVSNVSFYYGADVLLGEIDGELKQIGALFHRESIPE